MSRSPRSRNVSRRKPFIRLITFVLVTAAFIAGGYFAKFYFIIPTGKKIAPKGEERRVPMSIKRPKSEVLLFLPKQNPKATYLAPVKIEVPATSNLPQAAMEGLIAKSEEKGSSHNLIPIGTKVLGVKISKGEAEVNLSKDFVSNFSGGSHQEAMTLNAIFHTMEQFKGVKKTRILIEGKTMDTLGGHIDTSAPMEADPEWLESSDNS